MIVSEINNTSWSLSIETEGEAVQGLEDIKQQVLVALGTDKGSLPYAPEFGFNIAALVDKPVNFVIPNGKLGILDTLTNDVPLVKVEGIEHTLDLAHVTFTVYVSTNLGNFAVEIPSEEGFSPTIGGPFSSGFGGGFA